MTTTPDAAGPLDVTVSGLPEPTEEERYLDALAAEYHERTEAYDRTVCTGPIRDGSILPATTEEWLTINKHAAKVRRELEERAMRERCLGRESVADAILNHDR